MNKLITKILLVGAFTAQSYAQSYLISNGGTISTCAGTLYDSGGANGNYSANENDTITICSSTLGNEIKVAFTTVDLELNYDYLYVYDGNSTTSPLLNTLTGTSVGNTFTSTSGCLTFVFKSDVSTQNSGFVGVISCIAPPPPPLDFYLTNVGFYASGTNGVTSDLPPTLNYNPLNPKNYINAGKYVRFKVECYANLSSGANLVSGECRIRTSDPGVTITDSISGLNNVAIGNSAWSTDEFELFINPTVLPGTTFNFDFVVINNQTNLSYITPNIKFVVAPLWIQGNSFVDDDSNPDSHGNNNDIAEPGETIEFLPYLNNPSTFAANVVLGQFFDPNFCSDLNVWDDTTGVSGNVVDNSYWNYYQNQAQIINPGAQDMVPQFDFVFDYNKSQTYKFEMGLDMAGKFEIFQGKLNLVKWYIPWTFNSTFPVAPPCSETSIIENGSNLISIFPNPTIGMVSLTIPAELIETEFTVFDHTGRVILKDLFKSTEQPIDLSMFDAGLYIIHADKETFSAKIIKN